MSHAICVCVCFLIFGNLNVGIRGECLEYVDDYYFLILDVQRDSFVRVWRSEIRIGNLSYFLELTFLRHTASKIYG